MNVDPDMGDDSGAEDGFDYGEFLEDDEEDMLVIDPTRPMIPAEIARTIPQLRRRIRQARHDLKHLAVEAARAKWAFEDAKHQAMKRVDGSNPDMRKAQAMTSEHLNERTGKTRRVTHLGYEMDLSEKLWRSQQQVLASLTKELDVVRSLMVTARDEAKD